MKCLSLYQPWAQLVVMGQKRIETRSWSTSYAGPLLIHASAARKPDCLRLIEENPHFARAFAAFGFRRWREAYDRLCFGIIIGKVDLRMCLGATSLALQRSELVTDKELAFGDFSADRHAWLLKNPVEFQHKIPYRGRQRLFEVSDLLIEPALTEHCGTGASPVIGAQP